MAITFDNEKKIFLLHTPHSTYVIRIFEGRVLHGGWVKRIKNYSGACAMPLIDRAFAAVPEDLHGKCDFSPDTVQWEYPVALRGDTRSPAIEVIGNGGTVECELLYEAHRIYKGKKALSGLPATYTNTDDEADTLEIDLYDPNSALKVTLFYTVWNTLDVICRHSVLKNSAKDVLDVRSAMSANVDFPHARFSMLQLSGAHARERHVIMRELVPGMQKVESRRTASSHQQNPFIALVEQGATETHGDVFGFNLVYSGNFTAQTEVDQYGVSRVQLGINPFNFSWKLAEGESFTTPETVMVYSQNGLGEMSRIYHDLYRSNLCRGEWRDKVRPIVINNWEATYFNFNSEKLFALADTAAAEGIELFVLDDGWFGKRNNDWTSLGDWDVFTEKLPNGLSEISEGIHARGMLFGLWFEPEMISPDSNLYRAHPDWCLHCTERSRTLGRHQLVLDMSRKDVVDYLFEKLSAVLSSCKIDYVKWDFNRSPSDVGSALLPVEKQQEVSHRFYLGLYDLLERLNKKFPHILFESCSGGGGRFDPAMLYYMPQTWTSDNTDGLSRLAIQEGTSIAYPASAMSCHVSAVPNHQVGRVTSLSLRGHVAMAGTFGYELDLNKLSDLEKAEIKEQVVWYKDIRHTAEFGDLYRLRSPRSCTAFSESPLFAWESVEKDKSKAVVTAVWSFSEANESYDILKLEGLDETANYKIKSLAGLSIKMLVRQFFPSAPDSEFCVVADDTVISGEELMNIGLCIINRTNYGGSLHFKLERV